MDGEFAVLAELCEKYVFGYILFAAKCGTEGSMSTYVAVTSSRLWNTGATDTSEFYGGR